MPLLARALVVVLAALTALAGVSLDLCACDGGGHGLFCAAPPAVAAAPIGCCGTPTPTPPGPGAHDDGDCACPSVAFDLPPAAPEGPPAPLTIGADDAPASPVLPLLTTSLAPAPFVARAPPPKLRRHLALHVLRL